MGYAYIFLFKQLVNWYDIMNKTMCTKVRYKDEIVAYIHPLEKDR